MTKKEKKQIEHNNVALSIVKTSEKRYSIIRIKFNLEETSLQPPEVVHSDLPLDEARERFRILAASDLFKP